MKQFTCHGCGATETRRKQFGEYADTVCAGCGYGITSDRCTGRVREKCYRCGTAKVDDLFKGTYCPQCNDWC